MVREGADGTQRHREHPSPLPRRSTPRPGGASDASRDGIELQAVAMIPSHLVRPDHQSRSLGLRPDAPDAQHPSSLGEAVVELRLPGLVKVPGLPGLPIGLALAQGVLPPEGLCALNLLQGPLSFGEEEIELFHDLV